MTDRMPKARICYVSAWALIESRRDAVRASLMAPISDHADYYDLIEVIERVAPKRLWPVHGPYADLFALDMARRFGIQSVALDNVVEDEATLD
jgi:mRNA degradation ribonuclease J1/J2